MRKLFFLPLLALALACQDTTPVEPALAISPDEGLVQNAARGVKVMKPVPIKVEGDWWILDYDYTQCEGEADLVSVFMEGVLQVTHLGRSGVAFSACWTPTLDFVSTQGTITAANGDELHFRGSAALDGTTHPFFPDGTWTIGPVSIIGGTGRFENAVGEYNGHGTYDGATGGTWISEGWISSVGSHK